MENTKVWIPGGIERETEKAILFKVSTEGPAGAGQADVWLPKSQLGKYQAGYLEVPEWLVDAKAEDMEPDTRIVRQAEAPAEPKASWPGN